MRSPWLMRWAAPAEAVHGDQQLAAVVGVDRAEGDADAAGAEAGARADLDVDAEGASIAMPVGTGVGSGPRSMYPCSGRQA
jgi:hypothetical protein